MIVSHSLSKCGSLGPAHEQPPVWRQKQTSSEEYLDNVLSTYLVPVYVLFQNVALFIPLTVEVVFVGVVGVIGIAPFMKLYKWIMNARHTQFRPTDCR